MRRRVNNTNKKRAVASSGYPHQKSYSTKMTDAGHVRVTVWVPEDRRDELRELAEKMRNQNA